MQLKISKILILHFCVLVTLGACGDKEAETPAAPKIVQQPASSPSTEEQPQPFFSGAGSKPEWKLNISANSSGSFVVVITWAGMPEQSFTAEKEPLYVDGKVNASSGQVKLSGKLNDGSVAMISLTTGACKDASGLEHSHECQFTSEKETLNGCGDYAP
jgi:hypothetical protein